MMKQILFYTAGHTEALRFARKRLESWGYALSPTPSEKVTHLLLPVPSFEEPGVLKGGTPLSHVLKALPERITILGGGLPELPCRCVDFLKDEYYLMENAAITAQCAAALAQQEWKTNLKNVPVLIIGWGRIGKQLVPRLKELGAAVTVAVRKERDMLALQAERCDAVLLPRLQPDRYCIVFNTAPAPVLDAADTKPEALLIDLASVPGIIGNNVLWARGLPNKYAPEASGNLIAKTALRFALGKE